MQNIDNIRIEEVKTAKQKRDFLNFPLKMYKQCPYFVPPLYMDEKKIFSKNYVYYDQAEAIYYLAYIGKIVVGRISGIIQQASNKKRNEKRVRFTRFDCIDDQEVANLLFSAVEKWAKDKGMTMIVGPLGFSDLEREGLLIDGFDQISTFEEQYNYPYYQQLIENYGFTKEVDWVERKVSAPENVDDKLDRISSLMLKKYNLRYGEAKNTRHFLKKYSDQFFDILDLTYTDLYGTVPFTDGTKKMLISSFKLIVDIKYVAVIVNEKDEVVSFGLGFPSIGKALQKSSGHLTIPALFKVLKAIKKPKVIDLGLIGVLPEYEGRGVSSALISGILHILRDGNIEYAETNLNLEDNVHIQNQWKNFDSVLHKRRRAFIKTID